MKALVFAFLLIQFIKSIENVMSRKLGKTFREIWSGVREMRWIEFEVSSGKLHFQGRGVRARRQASVGSRLAGRLSGVSQRSRVIRGRSARRQPVIFASRQVILFRFFKFQML